MIDPSLKIDTSFNHKWLYPWYVVKHKDGSFENTLSDSIHAEDTARQFYTAACTNTHLGSHKINYCKASLYNDDVELRFSGQPPGYNEEMVIVIRKDAFKGQYNFEYVALQPEIKNSFQIVSQKLVLKSKPVYDRMITGTIEVRFREKMEAVTGKKPKNRLPQPAVTYSKIYTLKGYFHTPLNDVLSIE